jgi:hypothetical protein
MVDYTAGLNYAAFALDDFVSSTTLRVAAHRENSSYIFMLMCFPFMIKT